MSENTSNQTKKIAALNDIFRQTMGMIGGGSVVQTQWVSALPEKDQSRIRGLVQTFNTDFLSRPNHQSRPKIFSYIFEWKSPALTLEFVL